MDLAMDHIDLGAGAQKYLFLHYAGVLIHVREISQQAQSTHPIPPDVVIVIG